MLVGRPAAAHVLALQAAPLEVPAKVRHEHARRKVRDDGEARGREELRVRGRVHVQRERERGEREEREARGLERAADHGARCGGAAFQLLNASECRFFCSRDVREAT